MTRPAPPWVLPDPPPPPGDWIDTSRWYLTLPAPAPDGAPVWEVDPGMLSVFRHPLYFDADTLGWVHYVAPVAGVPLPGEQVTRCELRELYGWWFDRGDHVLTVTFTCDLTSIPGPRRAVVAAIRRLTGGPVPLTIAVDQTELPGRIVCDNIPAGESRELLAGIDRDTPVTVRLAVTGTAPGRRVYVFAGYGDAIPATPALSWPVSGFAVRDGHGFAVGVANTVTAEQAPMGKAIVRHRLLTLV